MRPHPAPSLPSPFTSALHRRSATLAVAWATVVGLTGGAAATAQSAQPTQIDINRQPGPPDADSEPAEFTSVGAVAFFRARSVATGFELWVTDGTAVGTTMVADLRPGPDGSEPHGLTVFQGAVWFAADDGRSGEELWRVTPGGTPQLVADLVRGNGSSSPTGLTPVGNDLYFVATSVNDGEELFRLDGTTGMAQLVADIRPGAFGSRPQHITPFQGGVLFSANDGVEGREPWFSDGTAAGTYRIRAIVPGSAGSDPADFAVAGNTAWFSAADASSGRELWQTGGTSRSTSLVRDLWAGPTSSNPRELVALAVGRTTRVYFAADALGVGRELHVFDASTQTVSLVADLNPGPLGSSPEDLTPFRGRLAFHAANPTTGESGRQLWILDPAGGGLTWLDVVPEISYETVGALAVSTSSNGATLFGLSDHGMFATDGTPSGTLHTVAFGVTDLGALPGERAAVALPTSPFGVEPAVGESTTTGFTLLGDLNPGAGTRDSAPVPTAMSPAFGTGSDVAVSADDGVHGRELLVVDDATAQLQTIDIWPGAGGSSPTITRIGDRLWIAAHDGVHGNEPWISYGTAGTTTLLADLRPGPEGSQPSGFVAFGGLVLFIVSNGVNGLELWRTDATAAGTSRIAVLAHAPVWSPVVESWAGEIQGELFLAVRTVLAPTNDRIWRTDGTAAGTAVVTLGNVDPLRVIGAVGHRIVYCTEGFGLGTVAVAIRAYDVTTGIATLLSQSTVPTDRYLRPAMLGSQYAVFFATGGGGLEPWKTDGTHAGTGPIVDINLGTSGSAPIAGFARIWGGDDRVYFPADDGTNGVELWASDGTAAGTLRLTQAGPGGADADIDHGNPVGDGTALAVTIGGNPWFSMGTPSTTFEIADLNGADDDRTRDFVTSGGSLYFAGADGVHGLELWRVALAELGGSNQAAYGEGCSSTAPIALTTARRAAIGATFVVRASPVAPLATAVLLIGIGPAEIPLNGSCSLLTQPLLSASTVSRGDGTAAFPIPLANDPALVGAMVCCQAIAAAPGGAAYGVVDLSHGLQVVVGR
ncbi:MAG: hypothetical protein IPM29_07675 [Planctomycetes bacterium]|nr:hypothetical protein [Planctomycetota bacterium]